MPKVKKLKIEPLNALNYDINTLPDDLMVNIFKFLSVSDRLQTKVVTKRWFWLLNLKELMQNVALKLEFCIISPVHPPWSTLMQSKQVFVILEIGKRVDFGGKQSDAFWIKIGKTIETLYCQNAEKIPKDFLKYFPNLKKIVVKSLKQVLNLEAGSFEHVHIDGSIHRWISSDDQKRLERIASLTTLTAKQVNFNSKDKENVVEFVTISKDMQKLFTEKSGSHRNHFTPKWSPIVRIKESVNLLANTEMVNSNIVGFKGHFEKDTIKELQKFDSLQKVRVQCNPFSSSCYFIHDKFSMPTVKKVSLFVDWNYVFGNTDGGAEELYKEFAKLCATCTSNLVESFPNLEAWKFDGPTKLSQFLNATPKPLRKLDIKMGRHDSDLDFNFPSLEKLKIDSESHLGRNYVLKCTKWSTMLKLQKITIGKNVKFNQWDALVKACPAVIEAVFDIPVPSKTLCVLENSWQNLEKLHFDKEFSKYTPDEEKRMLNAFQGKFVSIRELNPLHWLRGKSKPEESYCVLFKKYSTLRQSLKMTYDQFCQVEFANPAKSQPKTIEGAKEPNATEKKTVRMIEVRDLETEDSDVTEEDFSGLWF